MTTIKKAYAYIRVSNPDQLSYREQVEAIYRFASSNQIEILDIFEDKNTSAKSVQREGIQELLKAIVNSEIDYVVAYDANRLIRTGGDYREIQNIFKALKVEVIFATNDLPLGSPSARFLAAIQQLTGESYSRQMSEMVKTSMQQKSEAGYSMQRPPLGYLAGNVKGIHQKNEVADALEFYFKQTISGKISILALQNALTRMMGKTELISGKKLRSIVSNPYYSGFIRHNGNLYSGLHEPLITRDEQETLMKLIG